MNLWTLTACRAFSQGLFLLLLARAEKTRKKEAISALEKRMMDKMAEIETFLSDSPELFLTLPELIEE